MKVGDEMIAHVEEGLGTKNLVADAMYALTGKHYYHVVAQDTVAMIVNDLITVGALPFSVAMHLAVGDADWLKDDARYWDLIRGWKNACRLSGAIMGPGETPLLKDIIIPGTCVLSGSAIGKVPWKVIRSDRIRAGDAIVFFTSTGIHANGLTAARAIAEKIPEGYLTPIPLGETSSILYGDALLQPTPLYCDIIRDCITAGIDIHYAVNITGHGWRKLMRAQEPFTYVIDTLPPRDVLFPFLQEHGPMDDREAYGTFNMGAGFAIYIDPDDVELFLTVSRSHSRQYIALVAGRVEEGEKRVVIEPKGLEYRAEELAVR
jgi:phosphoribosylformylglycinamidine cyclo-ligase